MEMPPALAGAAAIIAVRATPASRPARVIEVRMSFSLFADFG
jgi:hypothetical protein